MLTATEKQAPTTTTIPTKNFNRNPIGLKWCIEEDLELEYGYSKYMNVQTITIQEMPERAPYGQVLISEWRVDR